MTMNYTTLLERPDLFDKTLQIIEKSFDYSEDNSFSIDFSPLVMKKNWGNCHLLLIEDEVVGHIGILNKKISIKEKSFNIAMYGGIAIDEKHRGRGYFSHFFKDVLMKHNQDTALHMLWSDQTELYEKFNFYPCVDQYEYNQDLEDAEQYLPTKLNTLTDKEIKSLQLIYDKQPELRFERSFDQWCDLKEITSTDLILLLYQEMD